MDFLKRHLVNVCVIVNELVSPACLTRWSHPQLAVECMTEEEVMALYVSRGQELESDGKFKEAER